MNGAELVILWCGWIIAGGSLGPATPSIAGTAMRSGQRSAIFFSCGVLVGSATLGVAAALGMGAVMMTNAWVVEAVRYLGGSYLLYIAYRSLRSALRAGDPVQQKGHDGTLAQPFMHGVLIHLTNPKAILSWGGVFTMTLGPDADLRDVFGMFAFFCSLVRFWSFRAMQRSFRQRGSWRFSPARGAVSRLCLRSFSGDAGYRS